MASNVHLILHNVIGGFSVVVIVILGFFVLAKDYRKSVNITLGLTFLAAIVAIVSNLIGVSVADPVLSRSILMWNISVVFICAFNFHCAMAMLEREREKKWLITFVYALSVVAAAIFVIAPDTFIGMPETKLYFPNYYTPGSLHFAFSLIFKVIIPAYFIFELATAYKYAIDHVEKNRFLYFTLAFAMGWGVGLVPTFLTWNIPVDPLWGMLFPIVFAIPFTYAIFRYELLNIKIVAQKAFLYAASVIIVGILIGFFDLAKRWLENAYPNFPLWATPLVSAILIVAIGVIIWRQLKESEVLKYEFITTVTHKFRTPLTHIKWATENLKVGGSKEDQVDQLGYIESANAKLVELTDLLANASETDETVYKYRIEKNNLSLFADDVLRASIDHAEAKKIKIIKQIEPDVFATFDNLRLRFVLQTYIENAINYTPEQGTITLTVGKTGHEAFCSVTDTGIGIPKSELSLISTKLYRGARARSTDTEGMGIGLFVSKSVLARHHGHMIIDSPGENRGSTFGFTIPGAK